MILLQSSKIRRGLISSQSVRIGRVREGAKVDAYSELSSTFEEDVVVFLISALKPTRRYIYIYISQRLAFAFWNGIRNT